MRESRGLFQREADLRIGGEVWSATLPAIPTICDDVAAGSIGEVRRSIDRPTDNFRRRVHSRLRRQAAGKAQRAQETFGNGVSLSAGQPPLARGAVQTLD